MADELRGSGNRLASFTAFQHVAPTVLYVLLDLHNEHAERFVASAMGSWLYEYAVDVDQSWYVDTLRQNLTLMNHPPDL